MNTAREAARAQRDIGRDDARIPPPRRPRRTLPFSPPRALALMFLAVALLGGGALLLPGMTTTPITPMQALFTATSATMVTGLTVVDTGTTFTFAGQAVLLVLMQVGGIGTMVFAALGLLVSGGRPPLRAQIFVGESIGQTSLRDLRRVTVLALGVAITAQVTGALALALRFSADFPPLAALWHGVFHSISAFNNAGFGLWADSITRYATDPLVTGVLSALVLLGGLGFVVLADPHLLRGRASLHTRITVLGTLFLAIGGALVFWWIEADNAKTLAGHDLADQATMAWFMSVVPRTAGFNSVDVPSMEDASTVLTMFLMFIGGGTGSTAGGVKVTTVFVMLVATWAVLRQRAEPTAFGRTIEQAVVLRAFAILSISGATLLAAVWVLVLTQPLPFLDLVYEAISAFATVGMTRGITDDLDTFGQLVIMLLMFVGRLGPLTLAYTLATAVAARVQYPKAEVYVG